MRVTLKAATVQRLAFAVMDRVRQRCKEGDEEAQVCSGSAHRMAVFSKLVQDDAGKDATVELNSADLEVLLP